MMLGLFTPLFLFFLFTLIFSGQRQGMPTLNVGWVDLDRSMISEHLRNLARSDGAVRPFSTIALPFDRNPISLNQDNIEPLIKNGRISLAVEILPGLGEQVTQFKNWKSTFVRIHYDPSDRLQANMLKVLLTKAGFLLVSEAWSENGPVAKNSADPEWQKVASDLGQAFKESRRLMRERGNSSMTESFIPMEAVEVPSPRKINLTAAQQMAGVAIMFLLFSVARAGTILLEEKNSGTLKRILASPISINQLVTGKLFSTGFNGFAQVSLMCLAGWIFFHLPIFDSPGALFALIFTTALCAASFGLLFASFCQTAEQVQVSATLLILTMSLIGGSMVPRFLLPLWAQKLSMLTPNGWAMDGFLKVLTHGSGFTAIIPELSVLLLMTSVLLLISFAVLPKKLYE